MSPTLAPAFLVAAAVALLTPNLARGEEAWAPAAQDLPAVLAKARAATVENVCQPVKSAVFFPDNIVWAPNADGKTYDVVIPYEKQYGGPASVAVIDLGSGAVKVHHFPRGLGWHIVPWAPAADGKYYMSQFNYTRRLCVEISAYDPATNEFKLNAFPTPDTIRGETHPIAVGTDGNVYAGGSHPTAAATCVMIDTGTGAVTDYGACGPVHQGGCWAGGIGADATHIYLSSGRVPWYLLAIDKQTKKTTVLATTDTVGGDVSVQPGPFGVTARVVEGRGKPRQEFWCWQGRLIPRDQPCPWKQGPAPAKPLRPIARHSGPRGLTTYIDNVAPTPDGECELWVKADVPNAAKDPASPGWSCIRYQVETWPVATDRLIETAEGHVFGTGGNYAGHYLYDPAAGKSDCLGKDDLSHYSTQVVGSNIYMSGYPSAMLVCYDSSKPATLRLHGGGPGNKIIPITSAESNPRRLGYLKKSGCHKMYAAALGKSGCVYFGGRWYRNGDCGGLGWWDPAKQEDGGFWEIFSNQQVCFMCSAADGRYIVISTLRREDTVLHKPKPNEGKLFILDDATKKIVREITPVEGVRGPGPVAWAGGNRVIGWTNDPADEDNKSILYGVDVEKGEIVWKKELPVPLPARIGSNQMEDWDWRLGPDGRIWTFMGGKGGDTLVTIDPRTARIEPVCRIARGGRLAFVPPDLYLSGAVDLRRVKGLVPPAKAKP